MDRPETQRILFHPRATERTPLPAGAEDIALEVEPGVVIGCRFFSAGKEKPTILFFHGNGEIVADYDAIGMEYVEYGMNVLVTDYRGYGWSDGTPAFSTFLADSHVLYTELKKMLIVAETLARSQHRKSSVQFVLVDSSDCDIREFSSIW